MMHLEKEKEKGMLEDSRTMKRRAQIYSFVSLNPSSSRSLLTPFLMPLTL